MSSLAAKLGVFTPILTFVPGDSGAWEKDATTEDIVAIARAADRLGFDHLTCSEHIGIPFEEEARRGARYYDPLATFGYLSTVTEKIRFATYVLVLGYHHPLEIAKRYGTLDVLSGGRLVLGLGVGSLKAEFDLLGYTDGEYRDRGARADDAIRALRASLGRRVPDYSGPHYSYNNFVIDPCTTRRDVPIWIGGRSPRSLSRAVELGDGWAPFGNLDELAAMLARASEQPDWRARLEPLEIIFRHDENIDPVAAPEQTEEELRRVFRAGATMINIRLSAESRNHYIDQLEALAQLEP